MSKHFWEYDSISPRKKKETRDLIHLASEERFDSAFLPDDPNLTGEKASKAFAIYIMERRAQDSHRETRESSVDHRLKAMRESTLIKYSQYIPWLDRVMGEKKLVIKYCDRCGEQLKYDECGLPVEDIAEVFRRDDYKHRIIHQGCMNEEDLIA